MYSIQYQHIKGFPINSKPPNHIALIQGIFNSRNQNEKLKNRALNFVRETRA